MPRSDAASSVVKHRNASEFEVAGFRVKRGMTINRRFFQKLNEYKYRNATEFEDTRFRVHRQNAADTRNSLRKFLMSAAQTGRSVGARNDD